MNFYRRLTNAEFSAKWEEVRQRVFIDRPFKEYFEYPFRDRTWEVAPLANYPTRPLSPLSWIDYDGTPEVFDEYEPLWQTLRERGVERILVSFTAGTNERWANTACSYEVEPDRRAFDSLLGDDFFSVNSHPPYFSAEADWGLQTFVEEVSLLGGTPEFMQVFYRHAGGRDNVRKRFIEYDIGGAWSLSHYQIVPKDLPVNSGTYPFDDAPRKTFYDMVGWEMPAYDMDQVRKNAPWLFRD